VAVLAHPIQQKMYLNTEIIAQEKPTQVQRYSTYMDPSVNRNSTHTTMISYYVQIIHIKDILIIQLSLRRLCNYCRTHNLL